MINSENGKVKIEGTGIEILADFSCIYSSMVEEFGEEDTLMTIAKARSFNRLVGRKHENN